MSPPIRRLLLAWGAMAALTLAAIFVGHAGTRQPLGPALVIALLTLSFVKSAILLAEYLDLRHAPGWNSGLRTAIFLLLAIIAGLSLMARVA